MLIDYLLNRNDIISMAKIKPILSEHSSFFNIVYFTMLIQENNLEVRTVYSLHIKFTSGRSWQ